MAPELDKLGRVLDFGKIKEIVEKWINQFMDHNMCIFIQDPVYSGKDNFQLFTELHGRTLLVVDFNPTAENLAEYLFHTFGRIFLNEAVTVVKAKLWETPSCFAEYKQDCSCA